MRYIHEPYNARYLTYKEIANNFIMNDQFNKLFVAGHSSIVGPRGSGKTTLLKMLYPKAFVEWKTNHPNEEYPNPPFWGVFIPQIVSGILCLKLLKEVVIKSW